MLKYGTVCFDEISQTFYIGRVIKLFTLDGVLHGRILFDYNDEKLVEIEFKDADRVGYYTLFEEDIVQFKIATDKRTNAKRATGISLMEHSLLNGKERRERGIVSKLFVDAPNGQQLVNKYASVTSIERDDPVFFFFTELIHFQRQQQQQQQQSQPLVNVGDCVEFTVLDCQKVFDSKINFKIENFNFLNFEIGFCI